MTRALLVRLGSLCVGREEAQRSSVRRRSCVLSAVVLYSSTTDGPSVGRTFPTMRLPLLLSFLFPLILLAQPTVIRWAYGPFGQQGDAAFVVERGRIHQAAGPFGQKGPCIYVFNDTEVFHSADALGSKGQGAFIAEGDGQGTGTIMLFRCQGTFCSKGSCVLLVEGNKVFRGEGAFCNKAESAFVLEGNTVFLAEGPLARKTDAILQVSGDVPMLALLAILAGL